MIVTGSDIDAFDIDNNKIAVLGFSDQSLIKRTLMSEHYVLLTFNWTEPLDIERGDYIELLGRRYTIRTKPYPIFDTHTGGYGYELKFEAIEMFFQDFVVFYTYQGKPTSEWKLTGTPRQFLQIHLENINAYFNITDESEKWKIGLCPEMAPILISFDSQNAFDGLTDVAENFGLEWWLDYENKTLNLGYYEHGEERELRRDIELQDISRTAKNEEEYCNRVFALGSTRNIPKSYGSQRLRLPASNGDYVDAFPNMKPLEIVSKVKIFEHIYPKRLGTITGLRVDDTQTDEDGNPWLVYYFKDSGLNFKEEYILPGETLKVTFGDNSFLNGQTFELAYHAPTEEGDTGEFEIINDQSNNLTVPNDILKPRLGDFYTLFNFDITLVGDQYVGEAEQELLEETKAWQKSIIEDIATYTCPIVVPRFFELDLNFEVGQKVKMVSVLFQDGFKSSRVYGYEKYLCMSSISYVIGDTPEYRRLRTMEKNIEANKEIADLQYEEAMNQVSKVSKTVKGMGYLKVALENETTIEKGLLLTTLIRLGAMMGTEWKEVAGINGGAVNEDDVVAYFGGSLDDAILGLASIIFRMDGSGQLAKGNILWNALGELLVSGKFESNKDGNRITIDPSSRTIELLNPSGQSVGAWGFGDSYSILQIFSRVSDVHEDEIQMNGNTISFNSKAGSSAWYSRIGKTGIKFDLTLFPTKARLADLEIGEWYRDGDVIKMKIQA